jgi:uncharacterized protein
MKKRRFALLLTLVLALALLVPAFAAQTERTYVQDLYGLLSEQERADLEAKAQEIAQQYQFAVNIVIVDRYQDYNSSSVYEAAKTIYRDWKLGYGEDQDGILLLLSMDERDYANIAYGYGNYAFTDYGKEQQDKQFLDDFRNNDWYNGFSDYLAVSAQYLRLAREGTPYDVDNAPKGISPIVRVAATVILPLVIAALAVLGMKGQMKSVAHATNADDYVIVPNVHMTVSDDVYTHTTRTERKIERSERSSGGGTSVDSDGFSGSSGKF